MGHEMSSSIAWPSQNLLAGADSITRQLGRSATGPLVMWHMTMLCAFVVWEQNQEAALKSFCFLFFQASTLPLS